MLHSEVFQAFLITSVALTVVSIVLSRARVPTIVGFILTGMLIGPSGLNWIKSLPAAQTISELGIVLLMFSLGLEISLGSLKKMLRPLLSLGLTQVFGTIIISLLFFIFVLGFDFSKSFIFGSCLALSSTAVILKLLNERREAETPYGRVSVVILIFQDIASLPLMAAIPLLASSAVTSQNTQSLGMTLLWVLAFLSGCFVVGYYIIPPLFREVTKTRSREVFFFSIIAVTFIIAYLAEQVGLSMSLGAFLAGVLISESPVNKQALAEMSPFRDIFLGFFFASVGMMLDLNFVFSNLQHLAWLIPAVVIIKFTVLYVLVRRNSHSHGVSFASALALTQIGEFSFILAASAHSHSIINDQEFQYFLALAICSLLFTPAMFYFGLRGSAHSSWPELAKAIHSQLGFSETTDASVGAPGMTPAHQGDSRLKDDYMVAPRKAIIIGLGHAGQEALIELTKNGIPCVGVDINIENIKTVQALGAEGVFGDSTSPDLLDSVGLHNAFLVIITVSGRHVTAKILATIRQLNPLVKVLIRVHYLQEISELQMIDNDYVVVSEAETANAIVQKALTWYGLDTSPVVKSGAPA